MSTFPTTAELLISGEDSRMKLHPESGSNHYLCRPYPELNLLRLGSSTASTISSSGFEIADRLRNQMYKEHHKHDNASIIKAHAKRIRQEIRHCSQLDQQTDILLTASGTISHRHAFQIAQNQTTNTRPWHVLMIDSAETGRGVPEALCPPDQAITCSRIQIRDLNAVPLSANEIDSTFITQTEMAIKQGKNIFLVMVDQSKSGCIAPSLSCALDLRQRFQDQVHLLLDACQFRISKNTLKNYLEQNITVAITGSKFLAGPSFSAALLVPYQAAGLASKQRRTAINPGLLIRWQVALASWQAFQNLDSLKIKDFLQQFSSAIECHLMHEPMFAQLPAPALCRDMKKAETEWDHLPTIFSFMLRMPASNTFASHTKTLTIYQYIQQHLNPRLQLGRPIHAGKGSDGMPAGALRLCISAPMIIDAINNTQQNAIIHQGISALNQISLIVQNNLAIPNPA